MEGPENSSDKFEKKWREAFEDAEEAPPPSVWAEIDRKLLYEELRSYKNNSVYYKWGIAASIILAASLAVSQWIYFSNQETSRRLTGIVLVDQPSMERYAVEIPETDKSGIFQNQIRESRKVLPVINQEPGQGIVEYDLIRLEKIGFNNEVAYNEPNTPAELRKIPVYHYVYTKHQKDNTEDSESKYWAGVNLGSGNFNPNYQSYVGALSGTNNTGFSMQANDAVEKSAPTIQEGMSAGESISLGLNLGYQINDRWSVESGVQYARADATTSTNLVIQSSIVREVIPASAEIRSIPQVEQLIDSEDVLEYNYDDVELQNQFRFASIPVKAGYVILNNKLRLQVNAGFAANLYLGNTLSDPSGRFSDVIIGPGQESPYRKVSFMGLTGVQIDYQILERIDIVLEPNYRQSINSLTKGDSEFIANPSGFGLMTGLRYRFD